MTFSKDDPFDIFEFDNRLDVNFDNFKYTMSLWIKPDASSCYESITQRAIEECNIVLMHGVFMLYFNAPNNLKFYFFAKQHFYEFNSAPIFVPYN